MAGFRTADGKARDPAGKVAAEPPAPEPKPGPHADQVALGHTPPERGVFGPTQAVTGPRVQRHAAEGEATPFGTIVEDEVAPAPGQIQRSQFIAAAYPAIEEAVTAELAGTGRSAEDCPYLAAYMSYYREQSASHLERAIAKYARPGATDPGGLILALVERVRAAVRTWVGSGRIEVPPAQPDETGSEPLPPPQGFDGAIDAEPHGVRAQLGAGRPLEGSTRARMERGFGSDFGDVRIHDDARAARTATALSAHAFTVGRDVAFGAGEFRPGTLRGDLMLAHELAHVVQQGGAGAGAGKGGLADAEQLEDDADHAAVGALASSHGDGANALLLAGMRQRSRTGLRLQRCGESEAEKARKAELKRLGGLQFDFLEQQRKDEEEKKRKAAEEEAKNKGLPPPVAPPVVTIDDVLKKNTGADKPPPPTDAWTKLDKKTQDTWKERAKKAWDSVVASAAGTELEQVMKGKSMVFDPEDALKRPYFGAQSGRKLFIGMAWVEIAEKNPKDVWPNVAHELGGHFEYGESLATGIMREALERMPEAERKKWLTDKDLRTKLFDEYEYLETEIFAELRERRYTKPEAGPAPPNPTDDPDVDVPSKLREIKKNFHPDVASAIVAELKRRVDASPNILDRDKKFFADQVKAIFGGP